MTPPNEDGSRLWLRYQKVEDGSRLAQYRRAIESLAILEDGAAYGIITTRREDWNCVYYYRADSEGLGFNRSSRGSNAVGQYAGRWREMYDGPLTCPEEHLLWFHHVPWDYRLRSGNTLFDGIQYRYDAGVRYVTAMRRTW